jgi:hypothetical protein
MGRRRPSGFWKNFERTEEKGERSKAKGKRRKVQGERFKAQGLKARRLGSWKAGKIRR